ncbi:hypothetical protein T492DRAFT_882146 [Pavlovales sp. CCMP2436]|nr:hypothetical protein T492DRAFT_882146 [Pavlovales sp. CCMP2436]
MCRLGEKRIREWIVREIEWINLPQKRRKRARSISARVEGRQEAEGICCTMLACPLRGGGGEVVQEGDEELVNEEEEVVVLEEEAEEQTTAEHALLANAVANFGFIRTRELRAAVGTDAALGGELNNWKKKHCADGTLRPGAGMRVAARTAKRRAGLPARQEATVAPRSSPAAAGKPRANASSRAPAKPAQTRTSSEFDSDEDSELPSGSDEDSAMEEDIDESLSDAIEAMAARCFGR